MSFATVELSINLGGSKNSADPDKQCKTGGSYICSGPTHGCLDAAVAPDRWTCIGTSFKTDKIVFGAPKSAVPRELAALKLALQKLVAAS